MPPGSCLPTLHSSSRAGGLAECCSPPVPGRGPHCPLPPHRPQFNLAPPGPSLRPALPASQLSCLHLCQPLRAGRPPVWAPQRRLERGAGSLPSLGPQGGLRSHKLWNPTRGPLEGCKGDSLSHDEAFRSPNRNLAFALGWVLSGCVMNAVC